MVTHKIPDDMILGPADYDDEVLTADLTGTAGTVTDTTVYPAATQATKTEKVTVDAGTEQTVTFTTDIDQARIADTTTYPVADQDTNTEKVTVDGGSEQTVTFAGVTTSAASVASQMDAQLSGCSVVVEGGQVFCSFTDVQTGYGLGSFRSDADGSDAVAIPGAKYVTAAAAAGLAKVELNPTR